MESIYHRSPVNKSASVVTSQSGCATDGTLSDEQLRENLVEKLKRIEKRILSIPKNSQERKTLGKEKLRLQNKIHEIRPAKKAPGVENCFIEVCRREFTKVQFDILMAKAVALMKQTGKQ